MKKKLLPAFACLLAGVMLFTFGLAPAEAFDKGKCKKNVGKLAKLVKPHKDTNFKKLLVVINRLDDPKAGIELQEIKESVDVPFEDLAWCKKFIKYLNKVEIYCAKKVEK